MPASTNLFMRTVYQMKWHAQNSLQINLFGPHCIGVQKPDCDSRHSLPSCVRLILSELRNGAGCTQPAIISR